MQIDIAKLITTKNPQNMSRRVLTFDPGETTGWSFFVGDVFKMCGQINTKVIEQESVLDIPYLLTHYRPDLIVYESYKIYGWMADQHKWSEVQTLQVIGLIRWFAYNQKIAITSQSAQIAKQFVTDEKLKAWKLWQTGQKHARDAIRHAVYAQIFLRWIAR